MCMTKNVFDPFSLPNVWLVNSVQFLRRPEARGRQLYSRACNFKSLSALLAGNFYTCYVEPNGLPLLMDNGTTSFI